jgi:Ca-activated chloride channel family protein
VNSHFSFESPWWALAWLALPLVLWLRGFRGGRAVVVPFASAWHRPAAVAFSHWPVVVACAGYVLGVAALMRPQWVEDRRETRREGYDILLAVDLSGSMLAEDYKDPARGTPINRLQAVKPVIDAFIRRRDADRIGIVVFAGRAYTLAPLTFDHDWLAKQVARLRVGMLEDGTAVGDGLGVALTRLEKKDAVGRRKGAFVVLLTDGANNRGVMEPLQAADIAKERGIPVYTIGAGTDGYARVPIYDKEGNLQRYGMLQGDLDERTLTEIANRTGAQYFRAADGGTIDAAFRAIDRAQKIEFQATQYTQATDWYPWVLVPGGVLLLVAGAGMWRRGEVLA